MYNLALESLKRLSAHSDREHIDRDMSNEYYEIA